MPGPDENREFEIIMWGASGFTGKLVAQYLASAPSAKGLRWAIAGRDRGKLEAVHAELKLPREVAILVGDARDASLLDAMCRRTRVMCTTVGPYARYGSELVAACVRSGTHCCDLTGEAHWVRRMIDAHHATAAERGIRIVNCCGFDSIPSDLGVLQLAESLRARGRTLARADLFVREIKGGASGGTFATAIFMAEDMQSDPSLRRVIGNPYVLVPGGSGPDRSDMAGPAYEPRLKRWTAPFVMAGINAPIVRRSSALLDYSGGGEFRYSERMAMPGGPKGLVGAVGVTAGLAAFGVGLGIPPVRRVIQKRLPQPGEGPSAEQRAAGRFTIQVLGEATPDGAANPLTLVSTVSDHRDPGYSGTAVMLGESALALARGPTTGRAGVLTPAVALGMPLIERLKTAGQTWTVGDFST